MRNEKQLHDSTGAEENSSELSKLFDYPSVGELFDPRDPRRFDEFRAKLSATRENLERVVRYGAREEAEKAQRAVRAVEVTLEFLENLRKLRQKSRT